MSTKANLIGSSLLPRKPNCRTCEGTMCLLYILWFFLEKYYNLQRRNIITFKGQCVYYRFLLSRRNIMAIISSTRLERREGGGWKNSCLLDIFTYLFTSLEYICLLDIFAYLFTSVEYICLLDIFTYLFTLLKYICLLDIFAYLFTSVEYICQV